VSLPAQRLAGALVLLLTSGCATTNVSEDRKVALDQAVAATQRTDYAFAANAANTYLQGGTEDDPAWDRGLLLLGRSLEQLGLTYASGLYYGDIAREKRDPTVIPDALRGIERLALSDGFDHETLIRGFLAASELPQLPPDIQGFVHFQKGLDALRNGDEDWAEGRFVAISRKSSWYHRARYVLAVRHVARGRLDQALKAFGALTTDAEEATAQTPNPVPADVYDNARRSLARIHLSEERYQDAEKLYESLRSEAPRDAQLLLELAWTHYHLGHPRRALGLLLALDAPVHRSLIAPERFLLEAMSLRRLCQFAPARQAAVRLRRRYGAELKELAAGIPPARSEALRRTARTRGEAAAEAALVDRIQLERRLLTQLEGALGETLTKQLRLVYARGLQESQRREKVLLADEAERLADELLQAEGGVRLILHELGVAILRGHGRRSGEVDENMAADPDGTTRVGWTFSGEFWTDELDDLVVRVEDRCIID
jgi:outer membrane protein assembly factor BamD (BamD/ComL family)